MELPEVVLMQQGQATAEGVIVQLLQLDQMEIIALVILEEEVLQDLVVMHDQVVHALKDQPDQQEDLLHVQQLGLVHQDQHLLIVDHHHLQEVVVFLEAEVLQDLQAHQEAAALVEEEEVKSKFFHLYY